MEVGSRLGVKLNHVRTFELESEIFLAHRQEHLDVAKQRFYEKVSTQKNLFQRQKLFVGVVERRE